MDKQTEVNVIFSSKCTADVYFDDKIVRIMGELGFNMFLASENGMKWMEPPERRDQLLTASEQQEVIRMIHAFYAGGQEKICFENNPLWDVSELKEELIKRKIPKEIYCLTGKPHNGQICLRRNGSSWEIFYVERRKKVNVKTFGDECSACGYFLSAVASWDNWYDFIHEQDDIKIHIKTRGHADIQYHGRTARFSGELLYNYFEAYASTMEWLPPHENDPVTKEERDTLISAVEKFYKHRKTVIKFYDDDHKRYKPSSRMLIRRYLQKGNSEDE